MQGGSWLPDLLRGWKMLGNEREAEGQGGGGERYVLGAFPSSLQGEEEPLPHLGPPSAHLDPPGPAT